MENQHGDQQPRELRMLKGDANKDCRGDLNGSGWKRWAETYLDSNLKMQAGEQGPQWTMTSVEGSEAARARRTFHP